jgi:TonB family protein
MAIRLVLAAGLLAATPALAQPPGTAAVRAASNWDTLLKLYPARAIAAREQGLVRFVVTLDAKGQPTECRVTQSSGYPLLDRETCQLITLHTVFKPAAGISGSQVSSHEGAVNWKLPAAAAGTPAAAGKPAKAAQVPKKVVCKRVAATGSNARTERVCTTRSDWAKASDEARHEWELLQGKGHTNGN